LCAAHDASLVDLADAASSLTVYAVAARYPGPAEPVRAEIEQAIDAMELIRQAILARVPLAD
jgi:hypothetical protein